MLTSVPFLRQSLRVIFCNAALFGVALSFVGCDETPPQKNDTPPETSAAPPKLPAEMQLSPVTFEALPGWGGDRPSAALPALRYSCGVFAKKGNPQAWVGPGSYGGQVKDWQALCADLQQNFPSAAPEQSDTEDASFRNWLTQHFQPYAVAAVNSDGQAAPDGTFTGYYEATLKGSLTRQPGYEVPLYGVPADLVTLDMGDVFSDMAGVKLVGRLTERSVEPYWTRADIESGALEKTLGPTAPPPVVAWAADPVDAQILHIQGSGVLELPNGDSLQVGYAGNNGQKFVGIGKVMLDRGLVAPGQASMPAIRAWLKEHPEQAPDVLTANPRYIFFRSLNGPGPIGAQGAPLTAGRSLAVDTRYLPLGAPVWLASVDPDALPLARLMVAQDVGSAIKGVVRGDFFWGSGEPALEKAGRMKSSGRYYLLLPRLSSPPLAQPSQPTALKDAPKP